MKKKEIFLTSQGYLDLENELNYLKIDKRQEVMQTLKDARAEVEKIIERRFKKLDEQLKEVLEYEQRARRSVAPGLSAPIRSCIYTGYYD